ncbi:MAG: heparinase II/III family protein [Bacteroidetes bacterium]|nr:heparinase II/III family protein [Bacteroidota bacterium]
MAKNRCRLIPFFAMFLCWVCLYGYAYSQQPVIHERNYLSTALNVSGADFSQQAVSAWRARQKENYLRKIGSLPDSVKAACIAKADQALAYNWPALPAVMYLEYKQTGNRIRYEAKQNERRHFLNNLVIGELITRNKKYLPQIVNGLWATLEESTWEIPAIVALQKAGMDLPDPVEEIIGLVGGETAVMVATIQYMLYDQLETVSPIIHKRVSQELHKRILDPYWQRDDYWWMGFTGKAVNNWNAWINTNVLQTVLLAETDTVKMAQLVRKIFRSTDHFLNQYPDDGGCDEGPSYWSIAGGKLVRLLQLAYSISGGKLNWSDNRLLHSLGTYIYQMHIAGDYFVNFADATPRTVPDPGSVYRFGEMFKDDQLKQFGAYLFAQKQHAMPANSVVDFLETADVFAALTGTAGTAPLPASSFLPNLQVLTARDQAGSASGLFLAVQGGHNGESHNHNDIGNFLVYANGKPVIIDAGVGTYTAQTFSADRYELWNMQSQWHNCPLINGVMQKDGKAYGATNLSYKENKGFVSIAMDIATAYPPAAFVKNWNRQFLFDQNRNRVVLSEKYLFEKRTGKTKISFLSSCEVKRDTNGKLIFYDDRGTRVLQLLYHTGVTLAEIEEKLLDDEKMKNSWGKKIYRLTFVIDDKQLAGENRFEFTLPPGN